MAQYKIPAELNEENKAGNNGRQIDGLQK